MNSLEHSAPERPFLQANEYKEKQYPIRNLLKQLDAEGKLTAIRRGSYIRWDYRSLRS